MASGLRRHGLDGVKVLSIAAVAVFFLFIFLPPVYVLSYAFKADFRLDGRSTGALLNSFVIGGVVTAVDVVFGLPVAWVLARRRNIRFRYLVDTLIDMPLVVPTSVLGLSVFYFWNGGMGALFGVEGGLIGKGPLLVVLLHVVFTFPYIVRSIEAAIVQIDLSHEQAATMLGASAFTVFRTISLPLFKAGLISGAILVFTRSLSETGATMMVAGLYRTAPTVIVDYKNMSDIPSAAAVSVVLVGAAIVLLAFTRLFSKSFRVPVAHVWPSEERSLSRGYVKPRDFIVSLFVLVIVLLPTFYIVLEGRDAVNAGTLAGLLGDSKLMGSIFISFAIGFVVTAVNLALAIPLGIVVAKNVLKIGGLVDAMSDIVLLVPTSALGLSLGLFWRNFALNEFLILVLAHLSFSFPLMLKPVSAALGGINPGLEDAARTMGAKPLGVFRTVVYPLVKPGILAGVIMTFMRSLSETGATLSVSENIKTIPVLLVDYFTSGRMDDKAILACVILFFISFAFIVMLKRRDARNA